MLMHSRRLCLLLAAGTVWPTNEVDRRAPVWVVRETALMGTRLEVTLLAQDRQAGFASAEAVFAAVRKVEGELSSWRDDTHVQAINLARPGRWTAVSANVFALLQEVAGWSHETLGAFDPVVGSLIDAWDLRGDGRHPSDGAIAIARGAAGFVNLEFDAASSSVRRLHEHAWLDAGGFGKGAALRAVRRVSDIEGVRRAFVNFGGQILAIGTGPTGQPWTVPVAHPRERDRPVATLALRDRSAATSGQSERAVLENGSGIGHVVDPRSGRPVPAWGSVTVVHEDAMRADVLATALFVMGPDQGWTWLAQHPDVAALFLVLSDEGVGQRATRAMHEYVERFTDSDAQQLK